jgi:hypothetical protein
LESLSDQFAQRCTAAKAVLLPEVEAYEPAIRDIIGLRMQDRMPRGMALDVAVCKSHHKDISLYF